LRALHNLATSAQTDALAFMLRYLTREADDGDELEAMARAMRGFDRRRSDGELDVAARVRELYAKIASDGLDTVDTGFFTTMTRFLDLPRETELRSAINRMRHVTWTLAK
jgi:ribose 1,5-bisphosphokinase PhnN